MIRAAARRLLCRFGSHAYPRSQGVVGYCTRGCGNLKRQHVGGAGWTRYCEPAPPGERQPGFLPRPGFMPRHGGVCVMPDAGWRIDVADLAPGGLPAPERGDV